MHFLNPAKVWKEPIESEIEDGNLGPTYNITQANTNNRASQHITELSSSRYKHAQSESRAVTYPQRTDIVVIVRIHLVSHFELVLLQSLLICKALPAESKCILDTDPQ